MCDLKERSGEKDVVSKRGVNVSLHRFFNQKEKLTGSSCVRRDPFPTVIFRGGQQLGIEMRGEKTTFWEVTNRLRFKDELGKVDRGW